MAERRQSPPPVRDTGTPKLKAPPGACDTHFHIFGPFDRFPLVEQRPIDVEESTLDDLVRLHDALGISRGVIVQSVLQGHAYGHILDALERYPGRFRAVAMPAPDISDAEIDRLTKAGVVGVRFAYRFSPEIDMRLVRRLHEAGWHPQFWFRGEDEALAWHVTMKSVPGDFVIDHMGWQPAKKGPDAAGFRVVLDCLETGRCWVKLSGPGRFSSEEAPPHTDVVPMARALVSRAPDRVLWGSDWPHPDHFRPMPNDADLLDLMLDWVPEEAARKRILVDNPAKLFGFTAS